MKIKNSMNLTTKTISNYNHAKDRSYIITHLLHISKYIFNKDMSQSNSRGNKKKFKRVYKVKQ